MIELAPAHVIQRRIAIFIAVLVLSRLYSHFSDTDESKLRPWLVKIRNSSYRWLFWILMGLITTAIFDYMIFGLFVPRFREDVVIGTATVLVTIIFAGAGFPIAKYLTETDYTPVEGFYE